MKPVLFTNIWLLCYVISGLSTCSCNLVLPILFFVMFGDQLCYKITFFYWEFCQPFLASSVELVQAETRLHFGL